MKNEYQQELIDNGFIRVDGILAYVHSNKDYTFVIPSPDDYLGKKYIAGKDFIFVFEKKSNQTWYKKVDLSQPESFRTSLFYIGYEITGDEHDEDLCGVNIHTTAFSLDFMFDSEQFSSRKLRDEYEPGLDKSKLHSCESVFLALSGDCQINIDIFLKYILDQKDEDFIAIPSSEFLKTFGAQGLDPKKPILFGSVRHIYMLVILLSWRHEKFPLNLSLSKLCELIFIKKP